MGAIKPTNAGIAHTTIIKSSGKITEVFVTPLPDSSPMMVSEYLGD